MLTSLLVLLSLFSTVCPQLLPPHMITPQNNLLTDPSKLLHFMRSVCPSPFRTSHLTKLSNEDGYLFHLDLPGIGKDDLCITASGAIMKIRGEVRCPEEQSKEDPTCIERLVLEEIRFPEDADLETAEAELENGVLHIFVKTVPGSRSRLRRIQVFRRFDRVVKETETGRKGFAETVKEKLGWT